MRKNSLGGGKNRNLLYFIDSKMHFFSLHFNASEVRMHRIIDEFLPL